MEAGGKDNRAPGVRPEGHNIEGVCHEPRANPSTKRCSVRLCTLQSVVEF
jgi:hypothetical protein